MTQTDKNGFALVHIKEEGTMTCMTAQFLADSSTLTNAEMEEALADFKQQTPHPVSYSLAMVQFTYHENVSPFSYEVTDFTVIRRTLDEPSVDIQIVRTS